MDELETLMAVVVVVADTCAVTARSMADYGRAWTDELELWMVCSIMSAALACSTRSVRAEGTQNFWTACSFDTRS